jgi:o-succinylbenzoate---CoA ligase
MSCVIIDGVSYDSYELSQMKEPKAERLKQVHRLLNQWYSKGQLFRIASSGSTGKAKPFFFSRSQVQQSALMSIQYFGINNKDLLFCPLSLNFVGGFMMLFRALLANATLVIIDPKSNITECFNKKPEFDFVALVPMQFQNLIKSGVLKYKKVRKGILIGGAPLTKQDVSEAKLVQSPVYQSFGMTETLSHIAVKRINGENPDSLYRLLPGIEMEIDQRNCLVIHVPFLEKPVITNDVVVLESDNAFRWVGRFDRVINSGGFKINMDALEAEYNKILRELSKEALIVLSYKEDAILGQKLIMIIESKHIPKQERSTFEEKLKLLIRKKYHQYEMPGAFIFLNAIPITKTGKTDRMAIQEMMASI